MKAAIFPGQGSQYVNMGAKLLEDNPKNNKYMEIANSILGFDIADVMINGSEEALKETKITQPAVFLYSIIRYYNNRETSEYNCYAGHSLGEITALVASDCLSLEDGLGLVSKRAGAMQLACEEQKSTMAAVLGLEDTVVEEICDKIEETVVAANYNCPGQIVISGSMEGIDKAMKACEAAEARRVLPLMVGGAFHSPLMASAKESLAEAIAQLNFEVPTGPVFQNVDALPSTDPELIQKKLIDQLTSPVKWTQTMANMHNHGVSHFTEFGAKVLSGFIKRYDRSIATEQYK
jgi:[acyl-carrier-protein] S-malonyltransferase